MKVSELKKEMDAGFTSLRQEIAAEGDAIRGYVDDRLEQRLTAQSAEIRRHFDVVAEQLRTELKLSLDKSISTGQQLTHLTASNAAEHVAFDTRLQSHETRLKALE